MEFGILFTSHPNTDAEPYPHRDVHARVTREIVRADELGFDIAWVAEHHFSNEYGIMPDVFVYAGYLAALTRRIKIGTAVVTLPLANPLRVAENAAFIDILSNGRFVLGLGSGYRKYEFDGFGIDFEARRDIQEEALPFLIELFHKKRADHHGKHFNVTVDGAYELFPHALQAPHPPIFLAGATDRSIASAGRMGFGLMLSTWTPCDPSFADRSAGSVITAGSNRTCARSPNICTPRTPGIRSRSSAVGFMQSYTACSNRFMRGSSPRRAGTQVTLTGLERARGPAPR